MRGWSKALVAVGWILRMGLVESAANAQSAGDDRSEAAGDVETNIPGLDTSTATASADAIHAEDTGGGFVSYRRMSLHQVLADRRDDVMHRWKAQVQGTLAPMAMPSIELLDHLPNFLDEVVAALRDDAGLSSAGQSLHESRTAAGHGEQRLKLGFSLDSVVREYGVLRDAIVTTAIDAGEQVTFREIQVVFDCMITGIAHAVSEYARQRDAELLRQGNEHFAFIAHELRNPLTAAMLAFENLRAKGLLPTGGREVGALERGLQRTNELIDQTLRIARIASGIELRRQWTTLGALFEDAETGAISEAESKGVEIEVVLAQDERLHVDVRLLRSAVGNLVRNAVKYTHAKSTVTLRGTVANNRIVIEVEDCCGGLEPGKVEQAFAPFVRLETTQSGFGLGLAIAKQAVDAHGGTIRVQNLPGKGCVFVLELPIET
ncbi:MAG: sensor histidine kinase [Polyangiaceae bacterium]